MKWPSAAQQKAGQISGPTGRLWRSDFYTPRPHSKIYATGIREPTPAGSVEYGISRRRGEDGRPEIYGWVRGGGRGWLSFEIADEVDSVLWDAPDEDESMLAPKRYTLRRVARISNILGIEAWVERRERDYRVEWREADGSIGWAPVPAAITAANSELVGEVLATADSYAASSKLTIVQIARRMPVLLPKFRAALRARQVDG